MLQVLFGFLPWIVFWILCFYRVRAALNVHVQDALKWQSAGYQKHPYKKEN